MVFLPLQSSAMTEITCNRVLILASQLGFHCFTNREVEDVVTTLSLSYLSFLPASYYRISPQPTNPEVADNRRNDATD